MIEADMIPRRLIDAIFAIAWVMVGVPAFIVHAGAPPLDWRWVAAFGSVGVLYALDRWRPTVALLAAQSAAAVALMLVRCNGYEGTLLSVVAMQVGTRLPRKAGVAWVTAQTLLLFAAVSIQFSLRAALLLAPPYLGFQLVAFFTFHLMARETAARAALSAANAELRAVQEILAASSRMAERLRIAQDLHDALGHRLTALTLNLEAALQRAEGQQESALRTAQALARELLADVRNIVSDARARDGIDLANALHSLAAAVPRPQLHLEIAPGLRIADPERAHILFRCAQEIVTNAARHSGAQNLWIVIERDAEMVRIRAHDDGRGSGGHTGGSGLRGMRERLESAGGELLVSSQPGRGFDVAANLPARDFA
jgi:signal transduction histidine kinase